MGATAYIVPEDLPKEIRVCSDSEDPGEGTLYQREFAAFQKLLFERIVREPGGNQAEAARPPPRLAPEFVPPPLRRTRHEINSVTTTSAGASVRDGMDPG